MNHKTYHIETQALHAGHTPDSLTLSRGVAVHRTSAYLFKDVSHAAELFNLTQTGNIYTRLMNPTHDVLERRMAALEGGAGALALASGTSAIYYSIINICKAGDEIVAADNLYGGTYTMFHTILPQFGINVRFVKHTEIDQFNRAVTPKTRALFIETIGNPVLGVTDIEAVAGVADKHRIPLIVDNTFATPYGVNPLRHGAHVVVHSLTKWLGGHGNAIGGIVVDSGKFDWTDSKFTLYNEPDESYHGVRFAHDLGDLNPLAFIIRMRLVPLRNLGACISPDNAWIFLQGIETLPLRMQRHCENAMAVAEFLGSHKHVAWVHYPGLPDDPAYKVAKKYMNKGFGGMVVFGVKGGYDAAVRLINTIELFSHCANVGDAKSLILHPASTSHAQLTEQQRRDSGLTPELIRLSIGLEHIDDLKSVLDMGLKTAHGDQS